MARRSTIPGNFSHTSLGKATHSRLGWQIFRIDDPDVVYKSQADFASDNGLTARNAVLATDGKVQNATNTVFTYNKTHANDDGKGPVETGDVFAMPLRDAEGRLLNLNDPFCLRLRIELISMTGDSQSSTSGTSGATTNSLKPRPQLAFGLCANSTNFQSSTNKHIAYGWRNRRESASSELVDEEPVLITECRTDTDGDGFTVTTISSGYADGHNIFEGMIFIGPDATEAKNAGIVTQAFKDAGDYFDRSNQSYKFELLDNDNNQLGTGQAYLFVAVGDCNSTNNPSGTDCVLTVRLSYMVEGDPVNGWGTS